ncbi:MAG: calcium-binding protein [Nostoc sp.]|uniref:beta strand repeat-containing protein n=1 Tax=Nostoc sp. TaxID=1180 RepID=UPI002FF6BE25
MANINGTNGNDTLYGTTSDDLINGLAGDDRLYPNGAYDTLNGGGGKDKFVYEANLNSRTIIIPDFDGIGKGSNPSAEVIASVDTLQFTGDEQLIARNLLLTLLIQNGNNLEISFDGAEFGSTVFLENFVLENLDNLAQVGNILFYGQTSIKDSFDVFNANSTQSTLFKKNTVTFLNELDNNVNGFDNSDDVINGQGGNDKIDGLSGNDLLRGGMGNNTLIGGAGDDTLRAGGYSLGNNLLNGGDGNDSLSISDSYGKNTIEGGAGDDTLNASFSSGDNLLNGGDGNDSLVSGASGNNTLNGGNGDDIFTTSLGGINNNILTGGGGKDKFFVYNFSYYSKTNNIITDFGGVNKNINPSAAVIAEVDTLSFQDNDFFFSFTAQNLLLTQNGNNLEITFAGWLPKGKLILENFALENLDNLSKSTGATVDLGNILFEGQTSITDSFDVFNANSTQNTVFKKNTVTFLNDLDNNVSGFDNSDDVINAQGGDDKIDGLSGNDLLRGGVGNNTLNGGTGDDSLNVDSSSGDNLLFGGDGNDSLFASGYQYYSSQYQEGDDTQGDDLRLEGNNTLNGGAGNDNLSASGSKGDNLLFGSDGNDSLSVSGYYSNPGGDFFQYSDNRALGNNTLNGGAGDDTLSASGSAGDNLLSGGDGNDSLSVSGFIEYNYDSSSNSVSSGNNTLNGGAGDDTLDTSGSTGDNLLFGGDGNDFLYVSTLLNTRSQYPPVTSDLVIQTVDAGKGDDLLSVDYTFATGGITSTFDATTNIGSITAGTDLVNYKFIERFNILGTAYDDNIVGNSSNDRLSTGSGGKDTIDGGKGDDVLSVNYTFATGGVTSTFDATTNSGSITAGNDRVNYKFIERFNISGTVYDDNIVGSNGNDTLSLGYDGNNGGKDTIDGGKGDDVLFSYYYYSDVSNTEGITSTFDATTNSGSITRGNNRVSYKNIEGLNIIGTFRPDNIVGSNGNDTLSGGYGYNDSSFYHELSDNDTLYGGDGIDTFFFHSINNNNEEGIERVYDFNATNELIQVSAAGFGGGLSIGSLKTSQFTLGTSATTSNQRFIYDFTTGALYFDSDGSAGVETQVQFAQLSPGLTLTENNFVVV